MTRDVRAASVVLGLAAPVGLAGLFLAFHGVSGTDALYGPLERLALDPDPERSLWHVSLPLAVAAGAVLMTGLGVALLSLRRRDPPTWGLIAYGASLVLVTAAVADRGFRSRFDGSFTNADPADPAVAGAGSFPLDAAVGAYFVLLALVALLAGTIVLILGAERRRK